MIDVLVQLRQKAGAETAAMRKGDNREDLVAMGDKEARKEVVVVAL